MANAAQKGKDIRAMYDRVSGNYDQLSPADHDAYLKQFGGNEEAAKRFWESIKNGAPSSQPSVPKQ